MALREDMEALERAIQRGPHHAKYWMFGEAARSMISPALFLEAQNWMREHIAPLRLPEDCQ